MHTCAAGVECLISSFSSLSTTFWPVCAFKDPLYIQQLDQVEKVACRWSAIEKNGFEARKLLVFDTSLVVAFKHNNK